MMSSFSTVPSASEEVMDRFLANVDVWQTIFEMLPVKDRIRLEMTNKRLHTLMFACWKRVTSFDTEGVTEMSKNPSISKNRWAAFVAICVNRIGDTLRSLTIREKLSMDCWSDNLPSIGEGCSNIETINFVVEGCGTLGNVHFDSFARLKTLTVSTPRGGSTRASVSVFLSTSASIEVIRGLQGKRVEPFENAAQVEGFFADRPSLREVSLGGLFTRDESKADIFRVIAERCPHLKSIKLSNSNCIDFRGVIALESMKQLCIEYGGLDEIETVTLCERSPLIEDLQFRCLFSSNLVLQSAALIALGSLTKLADLHVLTNFGGMVAPSLVTEFVRDLARNSGGSLRRLDFDIKMPLPRTAIEALANGCAKLRCVQFYVRVGEATPASIRFLIDCIVAHPSWIHETGERTLVINIWVMHHGGDEVEGAVQRLMRLLIRRQMCPLVFTSTYARTKSCHKWSHITR